MPCESYSIKKWFTLLLNKASFDSLWNKIGRMFEQFESPFSFKKWAKAWFKKLNSPDLWFSLQYFFSGKLLVLFENIYSKLCPTCKTSVFIFLKPLGLFMWFSGSSKILLFILLFWVVKKDEYFFHPEVFKKLLLISYRKKL